MRLKQVTCPLQQFIKMPMSRAGTQPCVRPIFFPRHHSWVPLSHVARPDMPGNSRMQRMYLHFKYYLILIGGKEKQGNQLFLRHFQANVTAPLSKSGSLSAHVLLSLWPLSNSLEAALDCSIYGSDKLYAQPTVRK